MPLPRPTLAAGTVTLDGGDVVSFHALTYAQAVKLNGYQGREDEASAWIVACACDIAEAEAAEWLEAVDMDTGTALLEAIIKLSGLEDRVGPKA